MKPSLNIDTKGHCLLCYKVIKSNKSGHCQAALQALLRYLQVDQKKLLAFSPNFLSKLEAMESEFDVKIPTCPECSTKVNRFHAAYQTFELCRLELESNLQTLHTIMDGGDSDVALAQEYYSSIQPNKPEQLGNAIGATVIRKQTLNKFKGKLQTSQPRVLLSRLETEFPECPPLLQLEKPASIVTQQPQQEVVAQANPKVSRANTKLWQCQYCPASYTQSGNLKYHTFRSHTIEVVSPHLPPRYKLNPENVNDGILRIMQNVKKNCKKHKCLYCPFNVLEKSNVKVHMINIHLRKFIEDLKLQLSQGRKGHEGQSDSVNRAQLGVTNPIDMPSPQPKKTRQKTNKKVKCTVCWKKMSPYGFSNHMRTHSQDNFSCEFCPRTTRRATLLRRHVEDAHLPNLVLKSLPSSYQSQNVSRAADHILENTLSQFVLIPSSGNEYKCPVCEGYILKPKRHFFTYHFSLFVDKVKGHLDNERRDNEPFHLDYFARVDDGERSSVTSSVFPMMRTLPVFPVDEVMQAVKEHDLALDDIFSVINGLD